MSKLNNKYINGMETAEEKVNEYLDKNIGDSLGSPINAAYSGFIAGYNEAMRCQSSPKIKQLEWDFYGTYYSAETPVIDYLITQENDFVENDGDCALWVNGFPISHSTLDDAKAAAQADFEKRVMGCLDL